jgi:hypothetical protein
MNIKINNSIPVNIQTTKTIKMDKPLDVTKNELLYSSIKIFPKNWKGVIGTNSLSFCGGLNKVGQFQHILSDTFHNRGVTEQFLEIETDKNGNIQSVTLLHYQKGKLYKVISEKDYGIIKSRFEMSNKISNKDRGVIPYHKCKLVPFEGKMSVYFMDKYSREKYSLKFEQNFTNGLKDGVEFGQLGTCRFDDDISTNNYRKGKLHGISTIKTSDCKISELETFKEFENGKEIFSVEIRNNDYIEVVDHLKKEKFLYTLKDEFTKEKKDCYRSCDFEKDFEKHLPKFSEQFPYHFKQMGSKVEGYLIERESNSSFFFLEDLGFVDFNTEIQDFLPQIELKDRKFLYESSWDLTTKNDKFISILIEGDLMKKTFKIFIFSEGKFKKVGENRIDYVPNYSNLNSIKNNCTFSNEFIEWFLNKRTRLIEEIEQIVPNEKSESGINEVYPMD